MLKLARNVFGQPSELEKKSDSKTNKKTLLYIGFMTVFDSKKKYPVVYMIYGNGLENSLIHGKTAKLKLQLFIFPFHMIIANLESFLNQQKDVKNCYVK